MKHLSYFLLLAMLTLSVGVQAQIGYWYQNEFIALKPIDNSYYYVQAIPNGTSKAISRVDLVNKGMNYISTADSKGHIVTSKEYPSDGNLYVSEFYRFGKHGCLIVLPKIALKVKDGYNIDNLMKRFKGLSRVSSNGRNVYIIDCELNSSEEVLAMSEDLHRESCIEWIEPIFLSNTETCNSYYGLQYYLKNIGQYGGSFGMDINAEPAWNIVEGSSDVTVAIVDMGVDFDHSDMSNCVLSGYTVGDSLSLGRPKNANDVDKKWHGVACAGIVGAENNSIGIKGVAYGAKILPINIAPNSAYYYYVGDVKMTNQGFANSAEIATAIQWAYHRADILSCSWSSSPSQLITDAINEARTLGRDGKGCIVVAASGNKYLEDSIDVAYPSILDGVISVGAVDMNGEILYYSQRGSHLNLAAISAGYNNGFPPLFVTTDRMGSLGVSENDYYFNFSGTSASCPQVAGVAALMLSANPDLTEAEVTENLQKTCFKLSGFSYNSNGWSNEIGYGLLNAEGAVIASLKIEGPTIPCGASTYYVDGLPNNYSVTWTWKNASDVSITPNTPATNQCTVTNSSQAYINNYLVATISKGANVIASIEKKIDTGINFRGTYQQAAVMNGSTQLLPAIGPNDFYSGNLLILNEGSLITLKSQDFVGANISLEGMTPFFFSHHDSIVSMKYLALMPLPRQTDAISPSAASVVITGTRPNNCETFQFSILLMKVANPFFTEPSLIVTPEADGYEFELLLSGLPSDVGQTDVVPLEASTWNLTIAHALTGKVVFDKKVKDNKQKVRTEEWMPGVYVVRAVIGNDTVTQKFFVSH